MARGVGNRQKKIVTAKKVWIRQPATPKSPERGPRPKKKTEDSNGSGLDNDSQAPGGKVLSP